MVLIRTFRLIFAFGYANLKSRWAYRGSFLFEIFTSLIYLGISLVFWRVIYSQTTIFAGWSLAQLFILMGFAELFWALQKGIFSGAFWLPQLIQLGRIEKWLASPIDSRLGILLEYNQAFLSVRSLPSVIIWFMLGLNEGGITLNAIDIILGILAVIMATTTMSAIIMLIGSVGFWLGQSEALIEFSLVLSEWARWPTNIFSNPLRFALTYIFPIALAATLPASVIARTSTWTNVFSLGIFILLFWLVAQEIIWRKGLGKYDGFGG